MTLGSNSGLSIGTPSAAPSQGLLVQGDGRFNGVVTAGGAANIDSSLAVQISTTGSGTQKWFGANKNGSYGLIVGYSETTGLSGVGAYIRQVTSDPLFFVVNNTTTALTLASTGAATFSSSVTASRYTSIGSSSYTNDFVNTNIGTVGQNIGLRFGYDGSTYNKGAVYFISKSANGVGDLIFALNNSENSANVSTSDERMRITSGGNVGIGTNSPGVKFVNSGGNNASLPTFGSGTIGSDAILSANGLYGLYTGVASEGHVWQQVQRNDGSTAVYPLVLQPSGGNVGIATTTPNSRLQVNGSVSLPHTTKSANYTLTDSDYTVGFDCASNRTATLPDATTCAGRVYVIYQYNTATGGSTYVTLDGNGSQTIDGVTTYSLQYQEDFSSVMIQSTGSNWVVISDKLYPSPV
jgi:hypothetical protein